VMCCVCVVCVRSGVCVECMYGVYGVLKLGVFLVNLRKERKAQITIDDFHHM